LRIDARRAQGCDGRLDRRFGVERALGPPLLAPKVLALQVHRDREHPRLELLAGIEISARAVQLQKGLLHQIMRFFAHVQLAQHGAHQQGRVALEDDAKCRSVTRDIGAHQLLVAPRIGQRAHSNQKAWQRQSPGDFRRASEP
jgi:hypothetical protein